MEKKKKKIRFSMPDAFIIIFGIIILSAIATYLVPSGSFERSEIDGRQVVIEGTYATTEASPSSIMDIFMAIHQGMVDSADLIFMVIIVGGVVAIFEHTGAINTGINAMIQKANGRKYPLVITFIVLFACMDMAGLSGNAVIAFIPIGIILANALKLDPIVGVAMIYLGQYVGVTTGTFDPVITGLAQKIAELPLFSGAGLRFVAFVLLLIITIIYICLYIRKISKDPAKSLMGISPFADDSDDACGKAEDYGPFTGRHKLVLLTFAVFIGIFLFGVFNYEWGISQLSAIFIMMGIVAAIIGGINANDFIQVFIKGAQGIVYGALVIGLARAAVILLENGNVLDTIVNSAFAPLSSLPTILGAEAIFFFNLFFNLLVTSGSGQASIVMPFIVPLVDMLDITRQTGVLAFKLGDGITNIITPTSGVLMAVLAVGKIPFLKWVKFIFPLVILWSIVAVILIAVAVLIDYGPF